MNIFMRYLFETILGLVAALMVALRLIGKKANTSYATKADIDKHAAELKGCIETMRGEISHLTTRLDNHIDTGRCGIENRDRRRQD